MEAFGFLQVGHVQFHKRVVNTCAGAKFEPVAYFLAEGVKGVGGTEAVAVALGVFAACEVTAIGTEGHCNFKSHQR